MEREKAIYVVQAKETGKPEPCAEIAEGKLKAWFKDVCLLEQESVMPDHEKKTITPLATELSSKCGEKVSVRRFACWQLGEGIEKVKTDLAADVAAEPGEAREVTSITCSAAGLMRPAAAPEAPRSVLATQPPPGGWRSAWPDPPINASCEAQRRGA